MPFTFSHPAAILPLRRWLPLSALAIGSLMPDLPYYFPRFLPDQIFGHTARGLVMLCLPAGLVMYLVFHALLKHGGIALLPEREQAKLAPDLGWPPLRGKHWLLIAAAILAGAITHIVWDSFTHRNGWFVVQFPTLRTTLLSISGRPVRLYGVLQHASTAIGAAILMVSYWRWSRIAAAERSRRPLFPATARTLVVLAFAALSALAAYIEVRSDVGVKDVVVRAIQALGICLLFWSVACVAIQTWVRRPRL